MDLTLLNMNGLLDVATFHPNDRVANAAMRMLNNLYKEEGTFFFCRDCDGLAIAEKDCCLNKQIDLGSVIFIVDGSCGKTTDIINLTPPNHWSNE